MAITEDPSAMVVEEPRGLAALVALWRDASRRRKLASLAIALGIEGLILLLLLTLGAKIAGVEDSKETVTTMKSVEFAAPPAPEPPAESAAAETPQETAPVTPAPEPMRPSPLALNPQPAPPQPPQPPQPQPAPPQPDPPKPQPATPAKIGARIRPGAGYGPADTGNPRTAGDSELVGTAPNGEPLYAARWYREPTEDEMAGYLSTAKGPGVALIACKTVSGYYVEDCVLIGESPPGVLIGRAAIAASWQFRVRPARIGGREQFGSWVRIRVSYTERKGKP